MTAMDFVARLVVVGAGTPTVASIDDLRGHLASVAATDSIERGALGGRVAASLGWAFACGYEAALGRLADAQDPQRAAFAGALTALCASEEGGPHPRAIRTTLRRDSDDGGRGWRLSGRKTFVTLGEHADRLVVVATTGLDDAGRPRLRAAWVPANRDGVTMASAQGAASLPFAPEITHARLTLGDVRVADDELSPGDGYDDVLKPFRTIEDTHVMAAALGYGIRVARESGWDGSWTERAVASIAALRAIAAAPPALAETHVVLAGALAIARDLLDAGDWGRATPQARDAWRRDRPLLDVASSARAARITAAWRTLG